MADRILTVNAYTTFDFLSARVEGHGFEHEAPAVLNVTTDREDPDRVKLELELDNTEIDDLAAHAETVELTAEQARKLATALTERAAELE